MVTFANRLCKYELIFDDSHLGTFTSDEFLSFSLFCCLYLLLRVVCKFAFRQICIILIVAVVLQLSYMQTANRSSVMKISSHLFKFSTVTQGKELTGIQGSRDRIRVTSMHTWLYPLENIGCSMYYLI